MPRYELQPNCLFVDAFNLEKLDLGNLERAPEITPAPHILDKRRLPVVCLELDDVAGFITRFIVQGVETECLLPQIIASEYSLTVAKAVQEVQSVLALIGNFLRPRQTVRPYQSSTRIPEVNLENLAIDEQYKPHPGVYELNFRVNLLVLGGFKLPL